MSARQANECRNTQTSPDAATPGNSRRPKWYGVKLHAWIICQCNKTRRTKRNEKFETLLKQPPGWRWEVDWWVGDSVGGGSPRWVNAKQTCLRLRGCVRVWKVKWSEPGGGWGCGWRWGDVVFCFVLRPLCSAPFLPCLPFHSSACPGWCPRCVPSIPALVHVSLLWKWCGLPTALELHKLRRQEA